MSSALECRFSDAASSSECPVQAACSGESLWKGTEWLTKSRLKKIVQKADQPPAAGSRQTLPLVIRRACPAKVCRGALGFRARQTRKQEYSVVTDLSAGAPRQRRPVVQRKNKPKKRSPIPNPPTRKVFSRQRTERLLGGSNSFGSTSLTRILRAGSPKRNSGKTKLRPAIGDCLPASRRPLNDCLRCISSRRRSNEPHNSGFSGGNIYICRR